MVHPCHPGFTLSSTNYRTDARSTYLLRYLLCLLHVFHMADGRRKLHHLTSHELPFLYLSSR